MKNPTPGAAAVLVPAKKWARAPAWLAWRTGNRYIGWALLPPEVERIQSDLLSICHLRAGVSRSAAELAVPLVPTDDLEGTTGEPDEPLAGKKRKER